MISLFKPLTSKQTRKTIKPNGPSSPKQHGGIGYIWIPERVERNKFVETCFRTTKVSFVTEDGQVYNNVSIDKVAINHIEFPDENRTLGSPVVYMVIPFHDQPVILGVYNSLDEFSKLEEKQFNLERITSTGSVRISGKGKTGELFISVNQYDNNSSDQTDLQEDEQPNPQVLGGKIYIDVQNDSGTAELNVNVKGSLNIVTENKTTIKNAKELEFEVRDEVEDPDNDLAGVTTKLSVKNGEITFKIVTLDEEGNETEDLKTVLTYSRKVGLSFIDEFGNKLITTEDQVQVLGAKQVLGEGKEPLVLGSTFKQEIEKEKARVTGIINALKNSPTVPQDGGAAYKAAIASAVSVLQEPDYSKILSEKSTTD